MQTVQCSCGYVASGETGDLLLADVEAHIAAAHAQPDVGAADDGAETTTEVER